MKQLVSALVSAVIHDAKTNLYFERGVRHYKYGKLTRFFCRPTRYSDLIGLVVGILKNNIIRAKPPAGTYWPNIEGRKECMNEEGRKRKGM